MFSISIDRGNFFSAADFAISLRLAINMLLCSMTTASTFASVKAWFRVVKCQFGYRKVRYRGIATNGAQVLITYTIFRTFRIDGFF